MNKSKNNKQINDRRCNKGQRILKGQSKKDNPEKLATQGTLQDEDKQNKNTTQCVLDATTRT